MGIFKPTLILLVSRKFSAAAKTKTTTERATKKAVNSNKMKRMSKKKKEKAIKEGKEVIREYLHNTRSLPYTYAQHITDHSLNSLTSLLSNLPFQSLSLFPLSLTRFLRYHPVNEFEFFYESIGMNYADLNGLLDPHKFFLSEDFRVFDIACALSDFGFPWNSLGKLYKEEISIFSKHPSEINRILDEMMKYGFSSEMVTGICLIFPFVLGGNPSLADEIDGLFFDLRKLFIDINLGNCVDNKVLDWLEICKKVRIFYDLGCEKGKMGELMGQKKHIFLDYEIDVLDFYSKFFSRLSVDKEDVALLLLERPDIFDIDLEGPVISVSKLLYHFGLDQTELESTSIKYPYVLGRNKMSNLPEVMRALNLHHWFFDQMRKGNHFLLHNYIGGSCDEGNDNEYEKFLDRNQSSKTPAHTLSKLNFLHGIGFGENKFTIKVLNGLHGTGKELQERFDCLLNVGFQFSKLCKILSLSPKILNQQQESLKKKMKFLLENTEFSLEHLDDFPTFLCFDLEKRVKPRYRFHMWLIETGLSAKRYSLASILSTSDKGFIGRAYRIHPAAVKHWFECFLK